MFSMPDWLQNIGVLFTLFLGISFIVFIISRSQHRKIVTSRYEWLNILKFDTWLTVSELRKIMCTKKQDDNISYTSVEQDLDTLLLEGFIESERGVRKGVFGQILNPLQYRLTKDGGKKRMDLSTGPVENNQGNMRLA